MPGLIGFYCQDHPTVYSLGAAFGDRSSQYDFWGPNPIGNPEQFTGRTFVIVSRAAVDVQQAFASVESHHVVTHLENGQHLGDWVIQVCRGFQGQALSPNASIERRY